MVHSLVYVSEIHASLQVDADVQRAALLAIDVSAKKHNSTLGVRGILVYVAGCFIQWLEGEKKAVQDLMQRIARDTRHTQIQIVYEGDGPKKLNEWSMSLATRADKDSFIFQWIALLRAGALPEPLSDSVPVDIFQGLLAPRDLPLAIGDKKQCHIALVGQTGLWSAAVITYLSDLWKVPVQRTRLIGNQGFEREALLEYVDANHPVLGPVRVMNFSGNVLQLPWIRSILKKVNVHALFYSVNELDAALEFTETAMVHLRQSNKNSAILSLFGRTAKPLMEPIQDWFESKDMKTQCLTMSLADVANVWQTIESNTKANVLVQEPTAVVKVPPLPPSTPLLIPALEPTKTLAPAPAPALAISKVPVKRVVSAVVEPTKPSVNVLGSGKLQQLVSIKPTQAVALPVAPLTAYCVVSDEGHYWLESLLEVRGVQWAGMQLADKTLQAEVAVHFFEKLPPADYSLQTDQFKMRLAQEARLHLVLRQSLQAQEVSRIVTRYGNAFEVSYGMNSSKGTVVLMLHSHPGSADLAVVLSNMKKRLLETLPVFFQASPLSRVA